MDESLLARAAACLRSTRALMLAQRSLEHYRGSAVGPIATKILTALVRPISVSALIMGGGLLAMTTPAQAQVRFTDNYDPTRDTPLCISGYDGALSAQIESDCSSFFTGSDPLHPIGIYVGPGDTYTWIHNDGTVDFNAAADFYQGTTFHGPVTFSGAVNLQNSTLGTTTINNSGQLTTGGVHVTSGSQFDGPAIFNGAVNAQFVYGGLTQTTQLTVTRAALLLGGATITGGLNVTGGTTTDSLTATTALTAAAGATVDMGGNRIQNVGTPTAATDASNKSYVDGQVAVVQSNVDAVTTRVGIDELRITNAENINTVQDTRLTGVETENGVQNTRLTSVETKNTSQDARMTAIEAVDAAQSQQIGTLQDQVGDLQSSVNGLHHDIKAANAGIAAAVALGGTMVVPDSLVSVSFNLATYRGQQGFSGSLVGRVSPKVYVNAGVGASTVRGSTAGRVGISFGL